MISLFAVVLFGILFIISWKLVNGTKLGKVPNGPFPLPLLGNLLSFGKIPHLTFNKWVEEYGKIYQMYLGNTRHIVLSDLELIKKAFAHPSFTGRPRMEVIEHDGGNRGLAFTEGREWQEQRRFTLRHLRDFGFGKNYMEGLILEETDELLDWIKSQNGKSVSLNRKFTLAVINSLWKIITGQRFKQGDPKLEKIFDQLFVASRGVDPMLIMYAPRLAKLFPEKSGWNKTREVLTHNRNFILPHVDDHRQEYSKEIEENPRDFMDAYLTEINKTQDQKSSFYGEVGQESLIQVVLNLFEAGSLTTSTTLTWGVLYLILHLDVQKKFQEEIDEVVGKSRCPSLADRPKMIYTDALICEILRKSSIAPFGVFHVATEDATFEGYDMPKGTVIAPNQFYVHHDQNTWGDPENFRPERFINSEGKIHMRDKLIAFSIGKRVCPGETLARDEIFLFLTSLFQRFEIRADPNKSMPKMDPVPVFDMLEAEEFFVVTTDRV